MSDIKLWTHKKEQENYESLADLYAIIKTMEKLERAYVKDSCKADEYEEACERLIGQFKVMRSSMDGLVPNIDQFMAEYNMRCPMAAIRLLHSGLPATIEHKAKQRNNDPEAVNIAETVQHFITAMDAVKLNLVAVDQLCPLLSDLLQSMQRIQNLPPNFEPKDKVKDWYSKLYQKPANYELPESDVRQLLYELDASYNAFIRTLKNK